jgi:hypothetical protein
MTATQNAFHTTASKTEERERNVAHFVGFENGKLPEEKTIDSECYGPDEI